MVARIPRVVAACALLLAALYSQNRSISPGDREELEASQASILQLHDNVALIQVKARPQISPADASARSGDATASSGLVPQENLKAQEVAPQTGHSTGQRLRERQNEEAEPTAEAEAGMAAPQAKAGKATPKVEAGAAMRHLAKPKAKATSTPKGNTKDVKEPVPQLALPQVSSSSASGGSFAHMVAAAIEFYIFLGVVVVVLVLFAAFMISTAYQEHMAHGKERESTGGGAHGDQAASMPGNAILPDMRRLAMGTPTSERSLASQQGSHGLPALSRRAASDVALPPPICPRLVLPNIRTTLAIPRYSESNFRSRPVEVLGLTGIPLLQVSMRPLPSGSDMIEVSMAALAPGATTKDGPRSPRATASPSAPDLRGVLDFGLDLRGEQGEMYGTLVQGRQGYDVLRSGQVALTITKQDVRAHPGLNVAYAVTSPGGTQLANAGISSDAERLELRVMPGVDAVLALISVLCVELLLPK